MDESIRKREASDPPHHDDHHAHANTTVAKAIMEDPAAAAGVEPEPQVHLIKAPKGTRAEVQRLLNALPGLLGACDEAIRRETGVKEGLPFALVVFCDDQAMHASNTDAESMRKALINFGESLRGATEAQEAISQASAAANDDGPAGPV